MRCSSAVTRSSICRCSCERRTFVDSMRRRASSSSNSAACAPCTTRKSMTAAAARCVRFMRASRSHPLTARGEKDRITAIGVMPRRPESLAAVHDVVAAILRPRRLVMPRVLRPLFAVADRLDLAVGGAEQQHHPLDGIGALLAERDVVLARAALVRVALYRHPRGAVLLQVARMRLDQRTVPVLHDEAVEIEVDAALRQDAARIAQRVARARRRRTAHAGALGAARLRAAGTCTGRARGAAVLDGGFGCGRRRAADECRREDRDEYEIAHGTSCL